MAQITKAPTDGQKIATLIRILRGAIAANDKILKDAAIAELHGYGVDVADLLASKEATNAS